MKNDSMKMMFGCLGMLVIGIFVFGMMFISAKNRMVTLNENIDAQWAQVENQLKRRHDLIPNLVNTVKGYASHEKEIFTAVSDARARMMGAKTPNEKVEAAGAMESAISRLLMVSERYPDLKADTQFTNLQFELSGTENRIAVERMRYNDMVREYNTYVKKIPGSFYAGIFGFAPREFFEVQESEKEVPTVDFNEE